ncbi:MAG: hypothetical protein AAB424_01450 [Patescibacteria group bacterium]
MFSILPILLVSKVNAHARCLASQNYREVTVFVEKIPEIIFKLAMHRSLVIIDEDQVTALAGMQFFLSVIVINKNRANEYFTQSAAIVADAFTDVFMNAVRGGFSCRA